jgi:hypothetical protein
MMRKFLQLFPVFLFLLLLATSFSGCKDYNEVDLFPACDTTNATYSEDILPIFTANCMPCHDIGNYSLSGITLTVLDSARIPARNGLLLKAVTHDPSVVPMPRGGGKISDCDIGKIRKWIELGEPAK